MSIVVKIVYRTEDGRRVSTFATGKWQQEYKIGEWAVPKRGFLIAHAYPPSIDIRGYLCRSEEAWLAEAEIVPPKFSQRVLFTLYKPDWDTWWKNYERGDLPRGDFDLFSDDDAVLCTRIKLTTRLDI